MAEMLIQSESLVSIADKIRVLSGTEDGMSLSTMENYVDNANADINTEADLIAQIAVALKGKAVEGGDSDPILQDKTVTPTAETQVVSYDSIYDGLRSVTVNGDSNLIPENIAEGVNIFGVTGTHESGVTVRRTTGTFTTNYSGNATITCGFQPDLVVYYTGESYTNSIPMWVSFPFAESGVSRIVLLHAPSSKNYDDHIFAESDCSRTTTGFSVNIKNLDFDLTFSNARSATYNYIAIKYTV